MTIKKARKRDPSGEYNPTPSRCFPAMTTRVVSYKCKRCGYKTDASKVHPQCPLLPFCPKCIYEIVKESGIFPIMEPIEEVVQVSQVPLVKTTHKYSVDENAETMIMRNPKPKK